MTWPTAKLGEVADVRTGPFGSLLHQHDYVAGGVPLINPMHIVDGRIVTDDRHAIAPEKARELANYRMAEGDVVLGRRGEMGRCAVVQAADHGSLCGTGSLIIRPGPLLSSEYLRLLLSSQDMVRTMERASLGTTMPNLNQTIVADLPVRLPPLDDQRRIAAILDHADALRTTHRKSRSLSDGLGRAIFLDMFGDPDKSSIGQQRVKFGEIADLQGGRNLVADDEDAHSPFRVLKISAVTSGKFKPWEAKPLPVDYTPPAAHLVRSGDLLISRANTAELVGAVAFVHKSPSNLALPDKIWRFVWKDPTSVPLYYWALLQTPAIRRRISQLSSGTGGSMKNISKAKLEQLELPRVDVARQRAFEKTLLAIPSPTVTEFDELCASLQSRAFSGQL
jgi:type I restriction enzyme, S subunit